MKVGFVGLGTMGLPIALNLVKHGVDLVAMGRKDEVLAAIRRGGGRGTTQLSTLADCKVVFLCLPDGAAVSEVLLGNDGLARRLSKATIVDLSTIDFNEAIEFGRRLLEYGHGFVDAPISGMRVRALEGSLTVMCGAVREEFELAEPLLRKVATTILHMGSVGSGQLAKLANQILFDANIAAIAEIVPLMARMGLDPALLEKVINSGTGRSYASEFFLPRMLQRRFEDGYAIEKSYKDLVNAARVFVSSCQPAPVLAAATLSFQIAIREGLGHLDKGAIVIPYERMVGVRYQNADYQS